MLVEKPAWVSHINSSDNKCAIYGIDVHPSGGKFATAGGDNLVKIWSMEMLIETSNVLPEFIPSSSSSSEGSENEASDIIPQRQRKKLLASLSWHEQAVNCVRWNSNGRYLASGSDDQLVLIYEEQKGKSAAVPFGSNVQPNLENWVRIAILKSHVMDVQDIAWSPDDRYLASCSIDNKILIWSVDPGSLQMIMSQPLQVLTGHNSWVKGLTWDPVGKYLASAGEDKRVIVWRVEDWKIEKEISEPFEKCASSSHFRRLSWSPDGSCICATHAFKSKQDVGALLNRSVWTNELDLVGHRGVVTTARFNPRLLTKQKSSDGDQDLQNNMLFSCCAIGGEDHTLSIWLTQVARPIAIVKDCFDAALTDLSWSLSGSILLSCSLDGTICFFQFDAGEIGFPISNEKQSRVLQQKYGQQAGFTISSMLIENPVQLEFEENQTVSEKSNAPVVSSNRKPIVVLNDQKQQIVSKSKTGKKRITPVLLNTTSNNSSTAVASGVSSEAVKNAEKEPEGNCISKAHDDSKRGLHGGETKKSEVTTLIVKKKPKKASAVIPSSSSSPIPPSQKAKPSSSYSSPIRVSSNKRKRKEETDLGVLLPALDGGGMTQLLAQNLHCEVTSEHTTIRCTSEQKEGELCWRDDSIPGRITAISANGLFVAAISTIDNALYLFNQLTGLRLFPPLILGKPVSVLELSEKNRKKCFLMVILTNGELFIWDLIKKQKTTKTTNSIQIILDSINKQGENKDDTDIVHKKRVSLLRSRVTGEGVPILSFCILDSRSNKKQLYSYCYQHDMDSWFRIADDSFLYSDYNAVLDPLPFDTNQIPLGPLCRLQKASNHLFNGKNLPLTAANIEEQRNITRAHLETQLSSCELLSSEKEYVYWLEIYTHFLTANQDGPRLTQLADTFTNSGQPIMNLCKLDLLENTILPIVAKNRGLQRFVNEYSCILKELKNLDANE